MEAYGYKQSILNNLTDINTNSVCFYNYKGLNFLSKLKNYNQNIIFIFHGAISYPGQYNVVFRGYDYIIPNTDIICISDFLLDKYKNYLINWTLSTQKYHFSDDIYKELFEFLINMKKYKNIIFTGTSAGGFPSIKFASIFNSTAIISNSQLYLENYTGIHPNKFVFLKNMLEEQQDKLIYENKLIEKIILNSKPKKIIYYQNKKDVLPHFSTYKDFLQFKDFILSNNLNDICSFHLFEFNEISAQGSQHGIQFPDNQNYIYILNEYIKNT